MPISIEISEERIPTLSSVALEALELLRRDDVTNEQLERIIIRDPGLTSRVLLIANAPFYAGRVPSRTIADSIRRLGLRQLRNVVVAAAAGELFESDDTLAQAIWTHSLQTAQIAQILVQTFGIPDCEDAYVAGLLHDIGVIIVYQQAPELYAEIKQQSTVDLDQIVAIEAADSSLIDHKAVGGLVVRKWHMQATIAEAVRFHHDVETGIPPMLEHVNLVCAVALAEQLSRVLMGGHDLGAYMQSCGATAFWGELQLKPTRIEAFLAHVQDRIHGRQAA